jgi:hypothetical protein
MCFRKRTSLFTVTVGSTQSLTEMSTRNIPGSKGGRTARKAHNLTSIWEAIVYKMWKLPRLTTLWALTACYKDGFNFNLIYHV